LAVACLVALGSGPHRGLEWIDLATDGEDRLMELSMSRGAAYLCLGLWAAMAPSATFFTIRSLRMGLPHLYSFDLPMLVLVWLIGMLGFIGVTEMI
jgi:hypothetical protein